MNSVPPAFHLGYRPALDGLRGVCILLVLLAHGGVMAGETYAFIAVNTFFVLSGFLITCLLVAEWDTRRDISLRDFYLRRALRLLPALLALLILFVVFSFAMDPWKRAVRELHEALRTLFYFTNWSRIFKLGRNDSLAHTWSLSIEEQFYFLWPVILLWLLRRTSRSSLLAWIFLGTSLAVLIRIGICVTDMNSIGGRLVPANPDRLFLGLDTRADSLLMGCFAGLLVASGFLPRRPVMIRSLSIGALLACFGLAWMGAAFWYPSSMMIYAGWFVCSALAAIIVTGLVAVPNTLLHRLLESRPLVYLGQISYGLYLWHYPILRALQQHQLPWQHLAYLLPVAIVTLLSYYFIERPCLRFKGRFQRVS